MTTKPHAGQCPRTLRLRLPEMKAALARAGIAQRAVAMAVGLPETEMSKAVRQGTPIPVDTAVAIASVLGCDVATITAPVDPPLPPAAA